MQRNMETPSGSWQRQPSCMRHWVEWGLKASSRPEVTRPVRNVSMEHRQQVPGLKTLRCQAGKRLNALRIGMEEREGDTMLAAG